MNKNNYFEKAKCMTYQFLFHSDEHWESFLLNPKNQVISEEDAIIFIEIDKLINIYWSANSLEAIACLFIKLKSKISEGTIVKIHAGEDINTKGLVELTINLFTQVGCIVKYHHLGYKTTDLNSVSIDASEITSATQDNVSEIYKIIDTSLGGEEKFDMNTEEIKEFIVQDNNHVFIINHFSKIAGLIFVSIYANKDKKSVFIRGITVDKAFRGNGYANKLLYKAFNWAKDNDATNSMLWVEKNNQVAIHLYEKFGYLPYGDQEMIFHYKV